MSSVQSAGGGVTCRKSLLQLIRNSTFIFVNIVIFFPQTPFDQKRVTFFFNMNDSQTDLLPQDIQAQEGLRCPTTRPVDPQTHKPLLKERV